MAIAQPRPDQVVLISEPIDRDRWLAGEIDAVEVSAVQGLENLNKRLNQILAVAVSILVSTATLAITLLVSGAVGA